MTTIESFFVLAALVVFVGILVWRRDVRSGRIPRPKRRVPSMSLRERLGDTGFRKAGVGCGVAERRRQGGELGDGRAEGGRRERARRRRGRRELTHGARIDRAARLGYPFFAPI